MLQDRPKPPWWMLTRKPWQSFLLSALNLLAGIGSAFQVDRFATPALVSAVAFTVLGLGYLGSGVAMRRPKTATEASAGR